MIEWPARILLLTLMAWPAHAHDAPHDGRLPTIGHAPDFTLVSQDNVRVSLHDQRKIPMRDIAVIDHVGGASGLPDTEIREAKGAEHLLLLSNGSSVKGQLVAIRGGEGSADEKQPRTYVFRSNGREERFAPQQVTRVYLGSYPFAAITGGPEIESRSPVSR